MNNLSRQSLQVSGNTRPKPYDGNDRFRNICFTWNNYGDDQIDAFKLSLNNIGKWIFGYEVGEQGTKHLQGFIKLNKQMRFNSIKNILGGKVHFEKCKGSTKENIDYCIKDGKWETNFYKPIEEIRVIKPDKSFMLDILDIIKESADDRKVHWYWEPFGGIGKSSFCKYLCVNYNCIYIDEGKKTDILNVIYNMKVIDSTSVVIIDIPRDNKNNVSYKAIEQIKNGMILNTKYETGMKIFNSPHIIIFSNYPPDTSKLSEDRWNIVRIKTEHDRPPYGSDM